MGCDASAERMRTLAGKMRPQLHDAATHLAGHAKLINPLYVQTYGYEGLVGDVCNIYEVPRSGALPRRHADYWFDEIYDRLGACYLADNKKAEATPPTFEKV